METNSVKQEGAKRNLFTILENFVGAKVLFEEGVPIKFLPKIIFVAVIILFYIGNSHIADRTVRKIEKLKVRVDDLRADYTTLKADLMYSSKQSEVAKRVEVYGLKESLKAPYKIRIEKNEY